MNNQFIEHTSFRMEVIPKSLTGMLQLRSEVQLRSAVVADEARGYLCYIRTSHLSQHAPNHSHKTKISDGRSCFVVLKRTWDPHTRN